MDGHLYLFQLFLEDSLKISDTMIFHKRDASPLPATDEIRSCLFSEKTLILRAYRGCELPVYQAVTSLAPMFV